MPVSVSVLYCRYIIAYSVTYICKQLRGTWKPRSLAKCDVKQLLKNLGTEYLISCPVTKLLDLKNK